MKSRAAEERTFVSHDGTELFYRHWPALSAKPMGAIVLLHRGHEHSRRLGPLVHELNLPDFSCFAWDARGHGYSPGKRGFSPSAHASVRDLDYFARHISAEHGFALRDVVVIGQSMGAVLAAAWAHDYAPAIRGMVLAAPAFEVKVYVPLARPLLRLLCAVHGDFAVNSHVRAKHLTSDRARIASYESDPLIARPISARYLLDLHDLSKRVVEDAAAITLPTQLLISGNDRVVREDPQQRFFERLGAAVKERHVFDGFLHDTLGEKDRKRAVDRVRRFIRERFAAPAIQTDLRDADKRGFTREEADRLKQPLPAFSANGLYWRSVRFGLKAGGWFSKGIAVGQESGFDSGAALDYVYRNRPQGFTPVGRAIDKMYLNALGWKGIRQRKVHLEELIQSAMERVGEADMPLRILDIAAGHGRYVLEAIEKSSHRPESVLLRDFDAGNVAAGQQLIAEKELLGIASFEKGDAFDPEAITAVRPRPTIGIVSGLYELFEENGQVIASLKGLGEAIEEGGYLLYTGQPWHPQIEFIARALTSHRQGRAWVMRRRTQAELDQLVREAGFVKVDQRIDEWGVFSVSLARKV